MKKAVYLLIVAIVASSLQLCSCSRDDNLHELSLGMYDLSGRLSADVKLDVIIPAGMKYMPDGSFINDDSSDRIKALCFSGIFSDTYNDCFELLEAYCVQKYLPPYTQTEVKAIALSSGSTAYRVNFINSKENALTSCMFRQLEAPYELAVSGLYAVMFELKLEGLDAADDGILNEMTAIANSLKLSDFSLAEAITEKSDNKTQTAEIFEVDIVKDAPIVYEKALTEHPEEIDSTETTQLDGYTLPFELRVQNATLSELGSRRLISISDTRINSSGLITVAVPGYILTQSNDEYNAHIFTSSDGEKWTHTSLHLDSGSQCKGIDIRRFSYDDKLMYMAQIFGSKGELYVWHSADAAEWNLVNKLYPPKGGYATYASPVGGLGGENNCAVFYNPEKNYPDVYMTFDYGSSYYFFDIDPTKYYDCISAEILAKGSGAGSGEYTLSYRLTMTDGDEKIVQFCGYYENFDGFFYEVETDASSLPNFFLYDRPQIKAMFIVNKTITSLDDWELLELNDGAIDSPDMVLEFLYVITNHENAADERYSELYSDMKKVKFGSYSISKAQEIGKYSNSNMLLFEFEIVASELDTLPIEKYSFAIMSGLDVYMQNIDELYNTVNHSDAANSLKAWLNTSSNYVTVWNDQTVTPSAISDIGEYLISRFGVDGYLSKTALAEYAEKYFGISNYNPSGVLMSTDRKNYFIGGHGGDRYVYDFLSEEEKDDETVIVLQFYADMSKLIKSCTVTYGLKRIEGGIYMFTICDVSPYEHEPYHMSM